MPSARAEAIELVERRDGYRDARIAEANGEAARFTAVRAEYRKAPEVTRKRLYLETMEAVLPGVEKVIVEARHQVMPYLPLERARRARAMRRLALFALVLVAVARARDRGRQPRHSARS